MKGLAEKDNDLTMPAESSVTIGAPKKRLKIGVSGKRFVSPEERSFVYNEIKKTIEGILKEHGTTEFTGYTALAAGADIIFANVVKNEFHQPVNITLPFAIEEYKKDFEEEKDLAEFQSFLNEYGVDEIIDTIPPANKESRNTAYYNTGKKIVDETDEMIFIWDELKPGGKGGTAEIMGYFSEIKPGKKINYITVKPKAPDTVNELIVRKYTGTDVVAVKEEITIAGFGSQRSF